MIAVDVGILCPALASCPQARSRVTPRLHSFDPWAQLTTMLQNGGETTLHDMVTQELRDVLASERFDVGGTAAPPELDWKACAPLTEAVGSVRSEVPVLPKGWEDIKVIAEARSDDMGRGVGASICRE